MYTGVGVWFDSLIVVGYLVSLVILDTVISVGYPLTTISDIAYCTLTDPILTITLSTHVPISNLNWQFLTF